MLVDIEQLRAAEVRAEPGARVLLLSDRPHDSEAFLVREGELAFRFGSDERRAGAESWVFVPAGVPYGLEATGGQEARFLHVRVPSSGCDADIVVRRAGGVEGETIGGRTPDRRATLLVDATDLTVTEFAYGPGMPGAELHVHREHADAFLVVEGELVLHHRDGDLAAPAGTLVVLPPGVVHGFDNGPSASRFYNLHLPASGFADYLRGRNPDFDQHDPPADGGVDPASLVAVRLSG